MKNNSPILITGCPRSGASMVAGIFKICGAYTGEVNKMNENVLLNNHLVRPYFSKLGFDTAGQYPLPLTEDIQIPRNWASQVYSIISGGDPMNSPWLYKDAKSSLIWPVWNFAFPDAKWIIVRRRTGDIIQSCLKTAYMKAFKAGGQEKVNKETEEEAWLWWVHEYEKRFVEMIEAGLNCKVIWPDRMVDKDYSQLYETLDWVGLPWKSEVLPYIDPLLWTSRKKGGQNGSSNSNGS